MTQDEYEVEQEYYETECDFSDFAPTVPMPNDPPVTFDEDQYPFDPDNYLPNGELDQ